MPRNAISNLRREEEDQHPGIFQPVLAKANKAHVLGWKDVENLSSSSSQSSRKNSSPRSIQDILLAEARAAKAKVAASRQKENINEKIERVRRGTRRLKFAPSVEAVAYNSGDQSSLSVKVLPFDIRYKIIALRKTDDINSGFYSLDGLASSYPLIRKEEAKRRMQARYQDHERKRRRRERSKRKSNSVREAFSCGAFLPIEEVIPTSFIKEPKPRRKASRESLHDELLLLKAQLRDLKNSVVVPPSLPRRSVRFASPLVTDVNYRPYTDEEDIAKLYFQEDELDMLEEDRYADPGDTVECEYNETYISVAYQQRADE